LSNGSRDGAHTSTPFTIEPTALDEVKIVVPARFPDDRGFFLEVYRQDLFRQLRLPDQAASSMGQVLSSMSVGAPWPRYAAGRRLVWVVVSSGIGVDSLVQRGQKAEQRLPVRLVQVGE
jgi:hypothetical protein